MRLLTITNNKAVLLLTSDIIALHYQRAQTVSMLHQATELLRLHESETNRTSHPPFQPHLTSPECVCVFLAERAFQLWALGHHCCPRLTKDEWHRASRKAWISSIHRALFFFFKQSSAIFPPPLGGRGKMAELVSCFFWICFTQHAQRYFRFLGYRDECRSMYGVA